MTRDQVTGVLGGLSHDLLDTLFAALDHATPDGELAEKISALVTGLSSLATVIDRGVLDEPVKPCGCLSFGEDCDQCRTDPVNPAELLRGDRP